MDLKKFFANEKILWSLLIIFTLFIFLVNIQSDGIYSAQEGRAAIVAQNMIDSGNIWHISIKGGHETEKPVMCYWFYALSGWVFGVNEFSVRLPSVIASLLCVLMVCFLGRRIYDAKTGFMAGFILASMVGFINLGRLARIDIVLCAFYTLAMLLLYKGYYEKRRANAYLYLFYVVLALSVLIKGPVSVVLAGFTVILLILSTASWSSMFAEFAGAWSERRYTLMIRNLLLMPFRACCQADWKVIWQLKPLSGLVIGLLICAPWYIYESVRTHGEFAFDFFWNQNITRFTGINMSYCEGKRKSFFYYIPKLFAMTLPWSLLVPFCLFSFRRRLLNLKSGTQYLFFWAFAVYFFFSLAAIKRGDYLLPMYPALAVLLGRYVVLLIDKAPRLHRKWVIGFWILLGLFVPVAAAVRMGALRYVGEQAVADKINHLSQRDGMSMIQISDMINIHFFWAVVASVVLFVLIYILGKLLEKGSIKAVMAIFFVILSVFIGVYYIVIDPAANRFKTTKYFCERCQGHIPENAVVCFYDNWITEAVFFMNRPYESGLKEDQIKHENGKYRYEFYCIDAEFYDKLPQADRDKMQLLEKTIEGHQYPMVLVKIKDGYFERRNEQNGASQVRSGK